MTMIDDEINEMMTPPRTTAHRIAVAADIDIDESSNRSVSGQFTRNARHQK